MLYIAGYEDESKNKREIIVFINKLFLIINLKEYDFYILIL